MAPKDMGVFPIVQKPRRLADAIKESRERADQLRLRKRYRVGPDHEARVKASAEEAARRQGEHDHQTVQWRAIVPVDEVVTQRLMAVDSSDVPMMEQLWLFEEEPAE